MSSYVHIENLWADLAEGLVLDQYKDSANLKALVKVFVDEGQTFEDAAERLRSFWNVDTATGALLDLIGAVRRITRTSKETDASYRARIKADEGFNKGGTPDYVIQRAIDRSGDSGAVMLEEDAGAPVVFLLTRNGRQLSRAFTDAITPAGVLGVPAAEIVVGGSSRPRLVDAKGRSILCVARTGYDDNGHFGNILTDDGSNFVDDSGNSLTYREYKL